MMTEPWRSAVGKLNEITHTDPFRFTDLLQMFQQVFLWHGTDYVEAQFGVGLPATTPPLGSVTDRVARPWFFTRTLLFLGLAFAVVAVTYRATGNLKLVPALVFTGSFAAPVAVAIFFFECNLPANVSLYAVLRMFTWGGILGLVLTLILSTMQGFLPTRWLGASVAALTEEPAKLAAVIILASRLKYPWTLKTPDMSQANAALQYSLVLRGLLSPFGHVVWTAITAGALWRVVHDGPLRSSSFADWRFASPFIAAVLMHFTWNSGLLDSLPFFAKYMVLGVIAWTIAFGLLFTGFREVREAAASTQRDS